MSFDDLVTQDRKRLVLDALETADAYTANEVVLAQKLAEFGHRVSRDRLRSDLAWLAEQELLIAQQPGGVWVVTLTARGSDVARGHVQHPGVARPRPI